MIFLHFPERFFVCIIIFRSKGSKLAPVWQHIQQRDFSVISQNQPINTSVRLCCSHLESQTTQFFSEASCGIAAKNSPVAQKDVFLPACHYEKDVWQDILSNKMWIMTFLYSVFLRLYVMHFAGPAGEEWVLKPRNQLAFLHLQFPPFRGFSNGFLVKCMKSGLWLRKV